LAKPHTSNSFRELSLAFRERAQTIRHFGDEFAHGQPRLTMKPGRSISHCI
jgi:hypothetical protein